MNFNRKSQIENRKLSLHPTKFTQCCRLLHRPMRVPMIEDMRPFEPVGEHEFFIGEQFRRGPHGHDFPFVEDDRSRAKFHDHFQVVGGDDLRRRQRLEQGLEFTPAAGIEVTGGFVEHENAGLAGEHPGQADAAFFSATETVRRPLLVALEAHHFQRVGDNLFELSIREAKLPRPECDVLKNGGTKKLIVGVLKNQANLSADGIKSCRSDPIAIHINFARVRFIGKQAIEVQQQRRFARAIGADQAHAFTRFYAETRRLDCHRPIGIVVVEFFDVQRADHFHPRAHMAE